MLTARICLVGLGALFAVSSALGCSGGKDDAVDPAFEADYVEDYENDVDEDVAQAAEQDAIDQLDDLDDVEVLDETDAKPSPLSKDLGGAPASTKGLPKHAKHGALSILEDDPNFSGPFADQRLAEAYDLGADVIRAMVMWQSTLPADKLWANPDEPDVSKRVHLTSKPHFNAADPSNYDWTKYDTIVDLARAHGMKVLITLAAPMPFWGSEDPNVCHQDVEVAKSTWSCSWKPSPREYAMWVTAVGRHYKSRRIWGWTLWNEPNIGAFIADDSEYAVGMRYRRMWFAGRKALRKTAGVKARVFFADQANGSVLDSDYSRFRPFRYALCLSPHTGDPLPTTLAEKCPMQPRRANATGVAFHPYSSTPAKLQASVQFMESLVDEAERTGRFKAGRGMYLTEHAFLTAHGTDAGKLGGAGSVTPDQQAAYSNVTEGLMYIDTRVHTIAQYELYDEGRGIWDCGLKLADGTPKPAYAAYKIAVDVKKVDAGTVQIFAHARAASDTPIAVFGKNGDGSWDPVTTIAGDVRGWGIKDVAIGGHVAWRLHYATDDSREVATP